MSSTERPLSVENNPYLKICENGYLCLVPKNEHYSSKSLGSRILVFSDGDRMAGISGSKLLKPAGLRADKHSRVVTSTLPLDWQEKIRIYEKAQSKLDAEVAE